jgi:aspartate carbamoyltransferase
VSRNPFKGRTIQIVNDLSIDEQLFLYHKTRELKENIKTNRDTGVFRMNDPDIGIYLLFLENSTRTKESFRNAGKFHMVRVNDFSSQSSSLGKKETITDTIKMLVGYSTRSIFVVRSRLEGLCRWLERAMANYAAKAEIPVPAFINAGDGRHEHPTQEFLDEFSFLEAKNWNRDEIHLALVGDLFHGRTVHSKVDGLRIFQNVKVDLIAPQGLEMPDHYIHTMTRSGFTVRKYSSIEEYLRKGETADIWYFTRLQLERMGEQLLERENYFRQAVTFQKEYMSMLSENTRFYHPLPRHGTKPVIPGFLDNTPLNWWDEQSMNGYYTRIIELSMLGGTIGSDFTGTAKEKKDFQDDFVEESAIRQNKKPEYKVGIKPVENGLVIDHVWKGGTPQQIWDHIDKIRRILGLSTIGSHGVFNSRSGELKGIISLPGSSGLDERRIKMLGAISPGSTLNMIDDSKITKKYRLHMPPRIYDFEEISCKNPDCVSSKDSSEDVVQEFYRSEENTFICAYCEQPHAFQDIW